LRYGGTLAQIGGLTGGRGDVSTSGIVLKSLRIYGIYVGSRRMFEALNRAITINQLRPVIDKVFDFDDARSAYEYMASGAHFGKVVIRVS
jgi:NADPH:quinone reductase-like Zn-dependent oxidoreductase